MRAGGASNTQATPTYTCACAGGRWWPPRFFSRGIYQTKGVRKCTMTNKDALAPFYRFLQLSVFRRSQHEASLACLQISEPTKPEPPATNTVRLEDATTSASTCSEAPGAGFPPRAPDVCGGIASVPSEVTLASPGVDDMTCLPKEKKRGKCANNSKNNVGPLFRMNSYRILVLVLTISASRVYSATLSRWHAAPVLAFADRGSQAGIDNRHSLTLKF